jgi:hypothetical protein
MKFSIHFAWGLGLIAALVGCGGGGGGTPPANPSATTTVSGVALNSYLENAIVFLDLNGDGVLNNGEPSATTNANGEFSFPTTESLNGRFLVVKATTATKMDGALLSQGMTLMTPAEKPSVISPLTTEVVAKMKNDGLSFDTAKSAVQSELGLDASLDVMKDYIKEQGSNPNYAKVQNVSSVVSDLLKTVETQSTSTRMASLKSEIDNKLLPILALVKEAPDVSTAKQKLAERIQAIANSSGGGSSLPPKNGSGSGFIRPANAPTCVTNSSTGWLTDYAKNPTNSNSYDQAVSGCVLGQYNSTPKTLSFPNTAVLLTRGNIRALVDRLTDTTGHAPDFSFIIGNSSDLIASQAGTVALAITKGTSQVSVTIGVDLLKTNDQLIIRAKNESAQVTVAIGLGTFSIPINFTSADIIASTSIDSGNVVLSINVLGLLPKLDTLLSGTTYPTMGDYTVEITNNNGADWPFKTPEGDTINGINVGLPIR